MPEIIDKPTWMSAEQIEEKAEAILLDFNARNGLTLCLPIPVQRIAEEYFDLTIDWCAIPDTADAEVLACIVPSERSIRINEDKVQFFEKHFGSESFTYAHEIGHWVLHVRDVVFRQMSFMEDRGPKRFICRARGLGVSGSFEWQANKFAAALLLPETLVRDRARSYDLTVWHDLYEMKGDFGVTISALTRRLSDLRMIFVSPNDELFESVEEYSGQFRFS